MSGRALAVVAMLTCGCIRANGAFHCASDADCQNGGMPGTCEQVGYCSFVDPSCAGGARFGAVSGPYANQCVGAADAGVDAADAAIDAPIDAPPRMIDAPPDAPPPPAAFVAEAHTVAAPATTVTYSIATPPGSKRYLLVAVQLPSDCATPVPDIASITYDGVALARVATITGTPCGMATTRSDQWGLVAPTTGMHDVVITLSDVPPYAIHTGALLFTGIDQTTPVHATKPNRGSSNSSSVAVTSSATDLVVNTVGQGTAITAPGNGQTQRYLQNVDGSNDFNNSAASTSPGADATTTMTWTFGTADEWQSISTSLQP